MEFALGAAVEHGRQQRYPENGEGPIEVRNESAAGETVAASEPSVGSGTSVTAPIAVK